VKLIKLFNDAELVEGNTVYYSDIDSSRVRRPILAEHMELYPNLREADPGGLGACPQKIYRHMHITYTPSLISSMSRE
jgi:hypothetical protein